MYRYAYNPLWKDHCINYLSCCCEDYISAHITRGHSSLWQGHLGVGNVRQLVTFHLQSGNMGKGMPVYISFSHFKFRQDPSLWSDTIHSHDRPSYLNEKKVEIP